MNRDERKAARDARLEARRAERQAAKGNNAPATQPPPQRLTRTPPQNKPCGCTRSKG